MIMKSWDKFEEELLKDPKVKAEFDRLEPEYRLAREIISARLKKKLTQTELAREAGLSQVMIARLESGASNPTLSTVSRVARVLGKEVKLVGSR